MNLNLCLCYSEETGLYISKCQECKETIFKPYDKKGYNTHKIYLPQKDIKITIKSNFKYQSASFLYAEIKKEGKCLLDFSKEKLGILNHSSVRNFSVNTEDWESLFHKIAIACNQSQINDDITQSALIYINDLKHILEQNKIQIKNTPHKEKQSIWQSKFLILLFVGDKMRDLFSALKDASIENSTINNALTILCKDYLQYLKTVDIINDSRTVRLAQTLIEIGQFMLLHNKAIELLSMYQEKVPENISI